MFAGHFGVAAVVKAKFPELPLWSLIVGTQLYDIIYLALDAAGLESITGEGYGQAVIYAPYSHSLLMALIVAGLAVWASGKRWGRSNGLVLGAVIFSHWLLDLLLHRPDLPVLPGNWGSLPLMGLGLWNAPLASLIVEGILLGAGAILYARYEMKHARATKRWLGVLRSVVMALFLAGTLLMDAY